MGISRANSASRSIVWWFGMKGGYTQGKTSSLHQIWFDGRVRVIYYKW